MEINPHTRGGTPQKGQENMIREHKTYSVEVVIGCTGGGFSYETNDLKEVEETIAEYHRDRINAIRVWDRKINDFIYVKRTLCYKPETNLLGAINRDFRYKERHY